MWRVSTASAAERAIRCLATATPVALLCLASGCTGSTSPDQTALVDRDASLEVILPEDGSLEGDSPESASPDIPAQQIAGSLSGKELYATHCAACHGEQGDGNGVAATYLFPKPRDFRSGRFRLVSTTNNCPTPDDLDAVLVRGMPGSSMPSWAHLSKRDRQAIAEEVMRLWREGMREQWTRIIKEEEELTDDEIAADDVQEEIEGLVRSKTTPGESTDVPEFNQPDAAAIARGKETYVKLSCHSCHGNEGKGDGVQKMLDDEGYPTSARDYTVGIFKGGHDPASLYRRIAYGMPGTPMPSTSASQASPEQISDLAHFLRSLSDEATRQAAILNRERIVSRRVSELPEDLDSPAWSDVSVVGLSMTPLWWRDGADPGLQIQSLHDGQRIAFRLSWRDTTADQHAARGESFEDAVALQLYAGSPEPFLGMGDAESPVDVWFWDADRQGKPTTVEQLYPNAVVDIYPFSEQVVTSSELDRPGARTADQPEISLPALASHNLIVPTDDASGASSLTVGGPGSVTFRIPRNQLVQAHGQPNDGQWTVVMSRALAVQENEQGVALKPGGRASIAFAVWDGSHQDRDGKKQITIWQDLELEP
jgi:DMSO reductase family type II enzyme heme b subunit